MEKKTIQFKDFNPYKYTIDQKITHNKKGEEKL